MKMLLGEKDYENATGFSIQALFNSIAGRNSIKRSECKKEPIPANIRWTVWERDNFTCQKCGARTNLAVDHIHPESKGGKATVENCQTLCKSCNSRKGAR